MPHSVVGNIVGFPQRQDWAEMSLKERHFLTFVTDYVTCFFSLAHPRAHSGCDPDCGARRGACARTSKSAPGRLWASFSPVLRPVREVLSLDWDRKGRVTPASTASQEAWPGAEPRGDSRGESRKWSAGRRAHRSQGALPCLASTAPRLRAFRRSAPLGFFAGIRTNFWKTLQSSGTNAPRERSCFSSPALPGRIVSDDA
jgi:hypothetical protein